MSLFRRREDDQGQVGSGPVDSPPPGDLVTSALEHFAGLSVPERAAEVLAVVAPAITAAWNAVDWTTIEAPARTNMHDLLEPLVPEVRYKDLSPEQRWKLAGLRVTLAEAFQALVLSRMLIRQDPSGSVSSQARYSTSRDGLAALQREDVAEVVARRLPE